MNKQEKHETPIILFDGVCNFCNWWINFIIRQDKRKLFHFAPLQSAVGKRILQEFGSSADSAILINRRKLFRQSEVVVEITRILGGKWLSVYIILKIIPKRIRDGIYSIIAKNRYKWFGKRKECFVPQGEVRERFFD